MCDDQHGSEQRNKLAPSKTSKESRQISKIRKNHVRKSCKFNRLLIIMILYALNFFPRIPIFEIVNVFLEKQQAQQKM